MKMPSPEDLLKIQADNMDEEQIKKSEERGENYEAGSKTVTHYSGGVFIKSLNLTGDPDEAGAAINRIGDGTVESYEKEKKQSDEIMSDEQKKMSQERRQDYKAGQKNAWEK